MGTVATSSSPTVMDLDGRALLVPTLQSEPIPIHAVAPAPCNRKCPAGINVKAYVSLIAEERFAERGSGHLSFFPPPGDKTPGRCPSSQRL